MLLLLLQERLQVFYIRVMQQTSLNIIVPINLSLSQNFRPTIRILLY